MRPDGGKASCGDRDVQCSCGFVQLNGTRACAPRRRRGRRDQQPATRTGAAAAAAWPRPCPRPGGHGRRPAPTELIAVAPIPRNIREISRWQATGKIHRLRFDSIGIDLWEGPKIRSKRGRQRWPAGPEGGPRVALARSVDRGWPQRCEVCRLPLASRPAVSAAPTDAPDETATGDEHMRRHAGAPAYLSVLGVKA